MRMESPQPELNMLQSQLTCVQLGIEAVKKPRFYS